MVSKNFSGWVFMRLVCETACCHNFVGRSLSSKSSSALKAAIRAHACCRLELWNSTPRRAGLSKAHQKEGHLRCFKTRTAAVWSHRLARSRPLPPGMGRRRAGPEIRVRVVQIAGRKTQKVSRDAQAVTRVYAYVWSSIRCHFGVLLNA